MLLGAARYLAETRNFDGTVYLIFQPAEEMQGGGRVMLEEGLLERFPMSQLFGLHNWPQPAGRQLRRAAGPDHGRGRPLHPHPARPGRPRRDARHRARPAGRRRPDRDRPADHRRAQRRPGEAGGGLGHPDPRRRRLQRDPADRDARRHLPQLRARGARPARAADRRDRPWRRRGPADRGRRRLRARLSADRQQRGRDRRWPRDAAAEVVGEERVDRATAAGDGRRGLLLHARAAPGQLHLHGRRRGPRRRCTARSTTSTTRR